MAKVSQPKIIDRKGVLPRLHRRCLEQAGQTLDQPPGVVTADRVDPGVMEYLVRGFVAKYRLVDLMEIGCALPIELTKLCTCFVAVFFRLLSGELSRPAVVKADLHLYLGAGYLADCAEEFVEVVSTGLKFSGELDDLRRVEHIEEG